MIQYSGYQKCKKKKNRGFNSTSKQATPNNQSLGQGLVLESNDGNDPIDGKTETENIADIEK